MTKEQATQSIIEKVESETRDLSVSEYREVLEEVIDDLESKLDASENDKDDE